MYQPPIIEPPVSSSNSLNDVKLIVNGKNKNTHICYKFILKFLRWKLW